MPKNYYSKGRSFKIEAVIWAEATTNNSRNHPKTSGLIDSYRKLTPFMGILSFKKVLLLDY